MHFDIFSKLLLQENVIYNNTCLGLEYALICSKLSSKLSSKLNGCNINGCFIDVLVEDICL